MRVILFGATGMVGQGVLRECLVDPEVEQVLAIGRTGTGQQHQKLREIVHRDLLDLSPIESELAGYDACFFCLGVSSAGMAEEEYQRITYDLTLAVAQALLPGNPDLTFIYVSGQGTDSSERGRVRWARVKGRTENALLAMAFQAYMFRPGYIQPRYGVSTKNRLYRLVYQIGSQLYPILKRAFPGSVTTTDQIGRAMIRVAAAGAPKRVLETADINAIR
jgi:uncharacterized protein YbjT (DUF2867 family)